MPSRPFVIIKAYWREVLVIEETAVWLPAVYLEEGNPS